MRELSHECSTPTLAGIPDGSCNFMISASVVTVILEHPVSPIRQAITDAMFRRFVIGVARFDGDRHYLPLQAIGRSY